VEENRRVCVFCNTGQDKLEHYVENCVGKRSLNGLRSCKEERLLRIWSNKLDQKGKVLKKIFMKKIFFLKKKNSSILKKIFC